MAEPGDGYTGEPVEWRAFVRQHLSLKQRLQGRATPAVTERPAAAIVAVLAEAGIDTTVSGRA